MDELEKVLIEDHLLLCIPLSFDKRERRVIQDYDFWELRYMRMAPQMATFNDSALSRAIGIFT